MAPISHVSLDETLGVALLGTIAASILYGVTNVQTFIYVKHSWKDNLLLKSLVYFLWVLDSLHLALIIHTVYIYAVNNFGNPAALLVPSWSLKAHIVIAGLSDAIVRGLFCQRMWNLSKGNWYVTTAIALSTAVAFGGSLAFSIRTFAIIGDVFHLSSVSWLLYMSLSAGVFTDGLIAISLCICLENFRKGYPNTKSIVHVLMIYGINSSAVTSLCEIACLVTYITMPDNLIFIALFFVLPKLSLNALLATLNARVDLRRNYSSGLTISTQSARPLLSASVRFSNRTDIANPRYFGNRQPLNVEISTDSISVTDEMPTLPPLTKLAPGRISRAGPGDLEKSMKIPAVAGFVQDTRQ